MANIVVVPQYYSGTSFEEIIKHMMVAAKEINMPIKFIGPTKSVNNNLRGFLLDDERYINYQLKLIGDLIRLKDPVKILFLDFFNPGLDLLRYYHEQKNVLVKYGALLHGGTFFNNDVYNMPWLREFELAWAGIYDRIYVASNYAKNNLPIQLCIKAKVLPWGLDGFNKINCLNKKYDVIFPHRLSPDKGIDDLIEIIRHLPKIKFAIISPQNDATMKANSYYKKLRKFSNVEFILGEGEKQHNNTISRARVVLSCAKQETFGYSIMKSILSGCIPVLPQNQCYPEFFKKEYLYRNLTEAIKMIQKHISMKLINQLPQRDPVFFLKNNLFEFSFKKHFKDFFEK